MDREQIELAIQSLEDLMHQDCREESKYQAWFETHQIVFRVLGYSKSVPHPDITTRAGKKYMPDFLVERPNKSVEIFEIKTPACRILRSISRRDTFYAEFQTYCAQCIEYSEAFEEEGVRNSIAERYNLSSFNRSPASILIAGASSDLDYPRVHRLASQYKSRIDVYTYDDVLNALRRDRTSNFGNYDGAFGIGVHLMTILKKPADRQSRNHLLDIGLKESSDRISIYIDKHDFLVAKLWGSDGHIAYIKAKRPLQANEYEVDQWILFEAGTSNDGFGFASIQINGSYLVDARMDNLSINCGRGWVLGSDWSGEEKSWFMLRELAILSRVFSFDEKIAIRRMAVDSGVRFSARTMSLPWYSVYGGPHPDDVVISNGSSWMASIGHPVLQKQSSVKMRE